MEQTALKIWDSDNKKKESKDIDAETQKEKSKPPVRKDKKGKCWSL